MMSQLCEWIVLNAPQAIHDLSTSSGNAFLEVLDILQFQSNHEGFQRCFWGRVLEEDDEVWIWTLWETETQYNSHKESEASRALYSKLSEISTKPPEIRYWKFDDEWRFSSRLSERSWPSITMVCFDGKPSEDQIKRVRSIRGMSPIINMSLDPPAPPRATRGFLLPERSTYVILDCWVSPIREEELRGPEHAWRKSATETQTLQELFDEQVGETGCAKVILKHAKFNLVKKITYPNAQVKGQDVEFDWENGRRIRALQRERIYGHRGEEEEEEEEEE